MGLIITGRIHWNDWHDFRWIVRTLSSTSRKIGGGSRPGAKPPSVAVNKNPPRMERVYFVANRPCYQFTVRTTATDDCDVTECTGVVAWPPQPPSTPSTSPNPTNASTARCAFLRPRPIHNRATGNPRNPIQAAKNIRLWPVNAAVGCVIVNTTTTW